MSATRAGEAGPYRPPRFPTVCKVCKGAGAWPGPTSKRSDPPATCGGVLCRAVAEYGAADWAGQVRMARARQRAGVELTELDRRALAMAESRAA